jgi:probable HAF family extracellular repeat protein
MEATVKLTCITLMLFAALAVPAQLAAQQHHHYKLIDLGTFGGPTSSTQDELQVLNSRGMVAGGADTSDAQHANACIFFCGDPFISHAFQWRDGELIELPTLSGLNNSGANWVSDSGLVAGFSETAAIDPFLRTQEMHAVLWRNGQITDLGTLKAEGGHESVAFAVNSRGQVAGAAFIGPDDINPFGQQRPFLWENGVMHDLGTLGGPDAGLVGSIKGNVEMNESGQVVACSDTNSTINPVTQTPTIDPFLWDKEDGMIDLGTLGGTSGCAIYINNRGQVVGFSDVAGDQGCPNACLPHPFLWERGEGMKDLGTLGGDFGFANWISDSGEVAGTASTQDDQAVHAFLWKNGVKTDLGTLPGDVCSSSQAVNSKGQMVGNSSSSTCDFTSKRAFLWENGGPMVDLNTLVRSPSGLQLISAVDINDRGEIVAEGLLPNGDSRAALLIPCDENHFGIEGCDYSMAEATATATVSRMQTTSLSPDAIRHLMQSAGLHSTPWHRGIGAPPQK